MQCLMCNNRHYVVLDLGSNVINNMSCAFRFPSIGIFPCLQRDATQHFSHSPVPIPSVTPSIPRLPAQFGVWHVRVALNLKQGNREYSLLRARDQYLGNLLPDVPKQTRFGMSFVNVMLKLAQSKEQCMTMCPACIWLLSSMQMHKKRLNQPNKVHTAVKLLYCCIVS